MIGWADSQSARARLPGRSPSPRLARGTSGTLFRVVAEAWAAHGVATLRISTGGRGGWEGQFVDMTLERRVGEAVAAMDWIASQQRFDAEQISILGHSQGTLVAAAAAKRLSGTLPAKSVILWAPQANALETYKRSMGHLTYERGLHAGPDEVVIWRGAGNRTRAFKRGFFAGLADFDAVADIGEFGGPTLIVTGRRDRWSPTWRAEAFRKSGAAVTSMEFDVGHRMGADIGIGAVHAVSEATLTWLLAQE